MSTITLVTRYRPVRVGLLVEAGEIDDLVEAAGINTLLWGGIFNPMITVTEGRESADNLIRLFRPDVLQPIGGSKSAKGVLEQYPYLRDQHLSKLFNYPLCKKTGRTELNSKTNRLKHFEDEFLMR